MCIFTNQMKKAGLFVILIFRRKVFEKSTCFLLAGLLNSGDGGYKYDFFRNRPIITPKCNNR